MKEDSDNFELSDEEIDDRKHEKLLTDVLNLNKRQNLKKPSRTEPRAQISEFTLAKSLGETKDLVHINDLTRLLSSRKKYVEVSRKVKSTNSKSKTLPKPLDKHQVERIKRAVNYEKSRLQLDRWEALVTSNRAATNVSFPLDSIEKVNIEEKKAEIYPSTWRIKSDLQKELEKLEPKVEEYHIKDDEKHQYPLTLEELKERRKESAKLRAHQSYKEAKARRQNKIKSKKYHRIQRREKIKESLKQFEQLQKTNPEEALKKLEDIEKARAEERFSLRHKGTGQWAKNKQVRAKYDKESRQVLAQQLAISRDLTQKIKAVDSESEEEAVESEEKDRTKSDGTNPWVTGIKPDKDVIDFVSGYRKYWNDKNKEGNNENSVVNVQEADEKKIAKENNVKASSKNSKRVKIPNESEKVCPNHITTIEQNNSFSTSEWEVSFQNDGGSDIEDVFEKLEETLDKKLKKKFSAIEGKSKGKAKKKKKQKSKQKTISNQPSNQKIDLSMPSKRKKPMVDEEMMEQPHNLESENGDARSPDLIALKNLLETKEKDQEVPNINPNQFIQPKKTNLSTAIPDILTNEDDEEETDQRDIILEAFEDDDIAVDFEKEKANEIEKDTPKDIDLNLPGWGSWAGGNIDHTKRKRKRFIIKMPSQMPRKDDNKGSLIINEKAQAKIKPLLVSEVPFPFKSVKDYEASIRAPIGNTFVPETAFKRLIEPAVTTKMGAIIEPISKGILVGTKKF
ncbi:unnamed protein product [Phaedon cochleariae]|uniref:U3 small nucleolar RNA-associated protein 14 homolog A n=1 Tax=Phaedon cochleariae TaxID=80249 RepID=A0A9P0D7K8_PHACE|nr:unnamed protein product [Phaedon cochleariae]